MRFCSCVCCELVRVEVEKLIGMFGVLVLSFCFLLGCLLRLEMCEFVFNLVNIFRLVFLYKMIGLFVGLIR